MAAPGKRIGVFTLAMINVAIICSLRGLPMMAEEGFSLVFYYLAGAVFFLIPTALVSAELATGWPPSGPGGVYIWVKEAMGQRWGFLAIWLQWAQNVIWYPTALSFIAATVAYTIDPQLADSRVFTLTVILGVYWGGTIANLFGMKTSGKISILGVASVVFAALLVIGLGAAYLLEGGAPRIPFELHSFFPDLSSIDKIVFLAGVLVVVSGMEVSAVHAGEVRDPKHNYPKAIFLAAGLTMAILMLGSLAIAVVVPQSDLSLTAGLMEAFEVFLARFHIKWLAPFVAVCIVGGQLGEICSWIVGPSKGLYETARDGVLPPFFQKRNRHGVSVNILIVQALIVTALVFVFVLMPSVNSAYWILTALTAQLYILMYLLLFASALILRKTQPDHPRKYRIPGGKWGMWLTAGMGILGAGFTFFVGFFPPSQLETGSLLFYELFLFGGILVMAGAALIIYSLRKPQWRLAAPDSGE